MRAFCFRAEPAMMSLSNLFIGNAYAQTAPAGDSGGMMQQVFFIFLMIVMFYFLLLRPQQKSAKEQKTMIAALQKGDEVVAAGGLLGRVVKLDENYVGLEVADGVTVRIQKSAVQTVLPKGTIKSV
jgi:preprotein translocase subunit YajC